MKNINEYLNEQLIDEGKFSDWLKKAWAWLFGEKEERYDITSNYYDETEKQRYLEKHKKKSKSDDVKDLDNDIKIQEIKKYKVLEKVIIDSGGEEERIGFNKIKKYLDKHPDRKNLNDNNWFISMIFKTKKLTECMGLIGISFTDYSDAVYIYTSSFLALYDDNNMFDIKDVITYMKTLGRGNIYTDDERFIKVCNKQKVKYTWYDKQNNMIELS